MADAPKAFVSYSWTSDQHGQWVVDLATQLRESGIDVVLDKWDLKEGHDVNAFMETMASDDTVRKVIIVCDRLYAQKADRREGGVGTETQIITPEIYARARQDKFVALVTQRNEKGEPYLPVFYKGRLYIDLDDPSTYATSFEKLVRWVFNKPLYEKPPIGNPPPYITDSHAPSLGTTSAFNRALDAVRHSRPYRVGAVLDYLDRLAGGLNSLRLPNSNPHDFDEQLLASIEQFRPFRNEAIQIFIALAQQAPVPDEQRAIHRFFEQAFPLMHHPPVGGTYREWDFDNFRFMVQELFLYVLAAFLRQERFEEVSQLLSEPYYVGDIVHSDSGVVPFASLLESTPSLEHRNQRLKLNRLSVRGDLLKDRCTGTGLSFDDLMQADFTAFMRDCIDTLRSKDRHQRWWPDTLVYPRHLPFEIYARAQSTGYFERVKKALGIGEKADLDPVFEAFNRQQLYVPRWDFSAGANPARLLGYERLATLP